MMKRIFNMFVLLLMLQCATAKSVSDMFANMPDSIMPYITAEQRLELIKMKQIDPASNANAKTIFKTNAVLNKLTDDSLTVEFGNVSYDIVRLRSTERTDSVYCMLRTFVTPEKETMGYIYSSDWKLVRQLDFSSFVFDNDTLAGDDKRREWLSSMEFPLVEAFWDTSAEVLVLKLNFTMLTKEEKEQNKEAFLQRKVKWDGKRFNEY